MSLKQLCSCAVAVLMFGCGIALQAWAEEPRRARAGAEGFSAEAYIPGEDLGTTSTGTDVWKLACPSGTAKVEADVGDLGGVDGRTLTVTLVRASTGKASLRRAPDGGVSPLANLPGGSGTYFVLISKTTGHNTSVKYDSIQRCLNSAGSELPVSPVLVQDL